LNDRATLRRFILGDNVADSGPNGSTSALAGLTFQRTYVFDPYAVTSPRVGQTISATTPSTLEVYVNGALVRKESISPGTLRLDNLRVGGGAGVATYVVRDAFGLEQRLDIPFYVASSVLAKGIQEFSYSVGMTRNNLGAESWDYDRPAFLARHRLGLAHQMTVTGRAEGTDRLISGGPAITAFTPIGQVELDLGMSREVGSGSGTAAFASYSYLSRSYSMSVFGRATSDHYATLAVEANRERIIRELGGFFSVPIAGVASAGASVRAHQYRDSGGGWRVEGTTGRRIWGEVMLSATGAYSQDSFGPQWQVALGASYSFRSNHALYARSTYSGAGGDVMMSAMQNTPAVGTGTGYRAQFAASDSGQVAAGGQLLHQTSFGRYAGSYSLTSGLDGLSHQYSLQAAGALVVIPGSGLFPSLPVQDSFGLIHFKGLKNVRGFVNNQLVGRTNRRGDLVVPTMLSYYGNRLSIAAEDVPFRYVLEKTEVVIAPPQRGVGVAEFRAYMPHYYRGRLVVIQGGKRINPEFGQLRTQGQEGEVYSPLATQGDFELEGVSPGVHKTYVDFGGGTCEFELTTPDSDETVIELGELTCEMP